MITFEIRDMTCGHCVSAITQAVHAIDHGARIDIDLSTHQVRIEPAGSDADALRAAIQEAGYTPVPLAGSVPQAATPAARTGCCCR